MRGCRFQTLRPKFIKLVRCSLPVNIIRNNCGCFDRQSFTHTDMVAQSKRDRLTKKKRKKNLQNHFAHHDGWFWTSLPDLVWVRRNKKTSQRFSDRTERYHVVRENPGHAHKTNEYMSAFGVHKTEKKSRRSFMRLNEELAYGRHARTFDGWHATYQGSDMRKFVLRSINDIRLFMCSCSLHRYNEY